ncbi:MAG: hypothetical protein JWQ25_537 [Daejeonella sp.]|nr:hypothetical protein [Daejeonella sp.]
MGLINLLSILNTNMKKILLAAIFIVAFITSYSQETLQTVTARGNTTPSLLIARGLNTPFNAVNLDSRSWSLQNDINQYGDFSIGQATSQGGATYVSKLYLHANGNVGLGTLNPLAQLHVNGKGIFENNLKVFGTNEGWNEGISIIKASGWAGVRITRNDPATGNFEGNWALGYSGTTGNDFSISNNYGGVQYNAIIHVAASTRNVGIGTFLPDSKLTVKGKIHAEEVKIDLNIPAPDYVFESKYNLKSLPELEKFIAENKHLPEIPSAKVMKEEGIIVGEMQMKLLLKIEELTLHLIQQGKEIEVLKAKIKD